MTIKEVTKQDLIRASLNSPRVKNLPPDYDEWSDKKLG